METVEIDSYLTAKFWESSAVSIFSSVIPALNKAILPSGSVLFQTSGSSGIIKWVIHTRETLLESAQLVTHHLGITPEDKWLLALPIHHVGGFGILARSYISGCSIVQYEGKWNAIRAVNTIETECVTLCSFVPTQIVDIVNAELACPPSVRAIIVGGGALDIDLRRKAISLGWPILESYGMTETGSQIATQKTSNDTGISLIKGWSIRLDSSGVLEVKGKGLMKGYLVSDANQFEIITPFDKDGWFKTSDTVEILSSKNSLKFISRIDRTVKILGELVNLNNLEAHLKEITGNEVLIVEMKNERRGYTLHPIIERHCDEGLDLKQLELGGLYHLENVSVCECFPRNMMGKLDRVSLRELVVLSD